MLKTAMFLFAAVTCQLLLTNMQTIAHSSLQQGGAASYSFR
jgi:hypothetical protein